MQFLPLFTLFFLIFAAISASFVSSELSDDSKTLSYQGRLRALRLAHSAYEQRLYKRHRIKQKGKTESTKERSKAKKEEQLTSKGKGRVGKKGQDRSKQTQKNYFRIERVGSLQGAIYLGKCALEDTDGLWLKELAISYLNAVYGNVRFIKEMKNPNWAEELLSFIIAREKEAYQKHKRFLPLDQLCPEGEMGSNYFRLIRGTSHFDPLLGNGFLPLEKCITFKGNSRAPIDIHFANPQLLVTLFGVKGYEQLYYAECQKLMKREGIKKKDYSLDRDELKALLGGLFKPIHDRNIDYKYRKDQRVKPAYDPQTSISEEIVHSVWKFASSRTSVHEKSKK